MSARAIWKGELKLGSTQIGVKLYSAVVDRTVRFHILEKKRMSRVKQHMINPETGKEVPNAEIRKGYEIDPGTFVILNDDELKAIVPEPSREIKIAHFISPEQIDSQLYDRPYFLGPDGDEKAYFALAEALGNQDKQGVAHWVMRGKSYLGVLRAEDGNLMLITLRHPDEVVQAEDLPAPRGREIDKKELSMANQLVAMLDGEFNPSDFQDDYRNRVEQFIERKARGKAPRLAPVRSNRATASLSTALSKSIAALKKEKEAA
ncbi:MAG TPA: Ku protein [Blastocatellia bacterium]|jgi:DNA end-binding protein Ku|nr:Ku protein [Blastocatellia bacterium]